MGVSDFSPRGVGWTSICAAGSLENSKSSGVVDLYIYAQFMQQGGYNNAINRPPVMAGLFKGSLGGETSVLRTFRMSGKELVKERVSKETVSQGKS